MFEIHLREDYEDIFNYRDEEFKADLEARLSRSRSQSRNSSVDKRKVKQSEISLISFL
jgi:hypothetical protein